MIFEFSGYKFCTLHFSMHEELSLDDKGFMCALLGLRRMNINKVGEDSFDFDMVMLREFCQIGQEKLYKILSSLDAHGYIHREYSRDSKGRMSKAKATVTVFACPNSDYLKQ